MKRIILFFVFGLITSLAYSQTDHFKSSEVVDILRSKYPGISEVYITDHYTSQEITHTYFKQSIGGIAIYNSRGAIHSKVGNELMLKEHFLQANYRNVPSKQPRISAVEASKRLAEKLAIDLLRDPIQVSNEANTEQQQVLSSSDLSMSEISVALQYYVQERDAIVLVWSIPLEDPKTGFWTHYLVDANTGEIVKEISWTNECNFGEHEHECSDESHSHSNTSAKSTMMMPNSYKVYAWPVESPNFGDSSIVTSPWLDNAAASPNGWHQIGANSYTHSRGNNTDTYLDDDNTNSPTGGNAARADGGADLEFIFPLDLNGNPVDYQDAAITNTFYWTNLMHDVLYNYGFDEASGNFQEENFTTSGAAGDYVRSEVQDGSGTCNANFGTPADGGNPRMQMYLCNGRDGDLDNGVIAHEYGHGISNRLTGGPAAAGCLGNTEQMGEGWSDYFAVMLTIEPGDMATDSRPMGTWLFGQGPNGAGIRPSPYSTDFAINDWTYDGIKSSSISVPHGVGFVWCTMLWDMTWALIDEYGFDPDIYDGTGGNNIALQLIMEGMKLQPCSPGFVDGRDAILQADQMLYGGANECLIWAAFANRGLGYSASQGSSSSKTDGVEAFDMPPKCTLSLTKSTSDAEVLPGSNITYTFKIKNNLNEVANNILITDTIPDETNFVSASNGGSFLNGVVSYPTFSLNGGDSLTMQLVLQLKPDANPAVADFSDDMECGIDNWNATGIGSTSWVVTNTDSNSGNISWFAVDQSFSGVATLELSSPIYLSASSELIFVHAYDTEADWDGGRVFITLDNGETWEDLGPYFTNNGYNSTVFNLIPGFSGNSNGFVTSNVDLSSFAGKEANIRFQMDCDAAVGGVGWWVDDVSINGLAAGTKNFARIQSGDIDYEVAANTSTIIELDLSVLQGYVTGMNPSCDQGNDGSVTAIGLGGSGSYTYLWDDGSTSATRNGIEEGIYSVTINDGIESIVRNITLISPEPIVASAIVENESFANAGDGSIEVTISGGTPFYNYEWSNGAEGLELFKLTAGTYILTITDNKGCEKIETYELTPAAPCIGTGLAIDFQLDQYPEDFSFTLSDENGAIIDQGSNFSAGETFFKAYCIEDGCYTLEVDDSFGDGICKSYSQPMGYFKLVNLDNGALILDNCDYDSGFSFDFCTPLTSNLSSEPVVQDVSCNETSDGAVLSLGVSGELGIVNFNWNTGTMTEAVSNLSAGNYTVTITDAVDTIIKNIEILGPNYSKVYSSEDNTTGSLRDILAIGCDVDTILFADTLINTVLELQNGEIEISETKIIKLPQNDSLIIDALSLSRIFNITENGYLHLEGLKLINGNGSPDGGAIYNQGELILKNVIFENNQEAGSSKAIDNAPGASIEMKENVFIKQ